MSDSDSDSDSCSEGSHENQRNSETLRALTSRGNIIARKSLGLESKKRYGSIYIALKRFLNQYFPEFLNDRDCKRMKSFDDFNITPDHTLPWEGCLKEFFTSRQYDSRKLKKGFEILVHKKSMALNMTEWPSV